MAIIVIDCPHCSTSKVAATIIGQSIDPPGMSQRRNPDLRDTQLYDWLVTVGMICPSCRKPIGARLLYIHGNINYQTAMQVSSNIHSHSGEIETLGFKALELWPKRPEPNIPAYLPEQVERALLQAERNYNIKNNEEAAAAMYRRALELTFKDLYPKKKETLAARIKALVLDKTLPAAIGDWADEIKNLGNDAVHDEEPIDRGDLTAIRGFADAVLRYLYTLPAEIAARRKLPASSDEPS